MSIKFFNDPESEPSYDSHTSADTEDDEQPYLDDDVSSDDPDPPAALSDDSALGDESLITEELDEGGRIMAENATSTDEDNPSGEMTNVALDWIELEAALENNSPELHSFLNTITGDVIRIFEGTENSDARLKKAETSSELAYIEPISSRDQYRWMEEFIETIEDPTLKDKLNIAIDGKGAFRRFKDVLVGYPSERENWFTKRSGRLREHMQSWLSSKNIVATNTPPWESNEGERVQRNEFNHGAKHEGNADLRSRAHDVLDMVPSRELPIALAFLDFLRNRRDPRRGGRLS